MTVLVVRPETPGDAAAITRLVTRAFERPDEADLVCRLRAQVDVVLSLVAEADREIVGHVMLSPMEAPFAAAGLAPLAVAPDRQRSGIGAALIRAALTQAEADGIRAIFVLGAPEYYRRVDFRAEEAAGFASPYAGPWLMAVPLGDRLPVRSGRIEYAPAFRELG